MKQSALKNKWYWELIAVCPLKSFDLVSFYFFEEGVSGIEEIHVESAKMCFKVFMPSTIENPRQMTLEIERSAGLGKGKITVRSIEKKQYQDWREGWRDFFKPIKIGETFSIRPPWEESNPNRNEIVINPGQGFGTGYHESTYIALLLLEWLLKKTPIPYVIDVGAGSGILSIASILMKSRHVTAIDLDRDALLEIPKNLNLSEIGTDLVSLIQCGPDALKKVSELVVANIEWYILKELADDLKRLVCADGYLLMSGILTDYEQVILDVFLDRFIMAKAIRHGEWTGVILKKQSFLMT